MEGWDSCYLRVGLGNRLGQAISPETEDEAVVLHRKNVELGAIYLDAVEPMAQRRAQLGGDTPGPAVHQQARIVHGAEVAAGGNVAGAEVNLNSEGLQCAPAYQVLQGVVAEQGKVAGTAAGSNPRFDWRGQTTGALTCHCVQVGQARRLQLREASVGVGKTAQAVYHQHDDLGRCGNVAVPE